MSTHRTVRLRANTRTPSFGVCGKPRRARDRSRVTHARAACWPIRLAKRTDKLHWHSTQTRRKTHTLLLLPWLTALLAGISVSWTFVVSFSSGGTRGVFISRINVCAIALKSSIVANSERYVDDVAWIGCLQVQKSSRDLVSDGGLG